MPSTVCRQERYERNELQFFVIHFVRMYILQSLDGLCMRWMVMLIFPCLLLGCKTTDKDDPTQQARELVSRWQGQQIQMVETLPCRILGRDTLAGDLFRRPCKILVYVDSAGCTSCRMQPQEWGALFGEMQPVQDRVSVLFVFETPQREELDLMFLRYGLRYPYFQDRDEQFRKANDFPEDMTSQVFLLERDNKVVLVGNPVGNKALWRLYRNQISTMLSLQPGEWPEREEESKMQKIKTTNK